MRVFACEQEKTHGTWGSPWPGTPNHMGEERRNFEGGAFESVSSAKHSTDLIFKVVDTKMQLSMKLEIVSHVKYANV